MLLKNGLDDVYPLDHELAADLVGVLKEMSRYLLDTLFTMRQGEDLSQTWLYGVLPLAARLKMDPDFCEALLVTLATLAFKALGPFPMSLACRAEELLLIWALDEVETLREGLEETFEEKDEVIEAVIGDFDHEFLYDPDFAGADQIEALGLAPFSISEWFRPFGRPQDVTNPLTWMAER